MAFEACGIELHDSMLDWGDALHPRIFASRTFFGGTRCCLGVLRRSAVTTSSTKLSAGMGVDMFCIFFSITVVILLHCVKKKTYNCDSEPFIVCMKYVYTHVYSQTHVQHMCADEELVTCSHQSESNSPHVSAKSHHSRW